MKYRIAFHYCSCFFFFLLCFTVSSLGVIYVFKDSSPQCLDPPSGLGHSTGSGSGWRISAVAPFVGSLLFFCLLYVKPNFTLFSFSFIQRSEGSFILLLFLFPTIKRIKLLYESPCHFISRPDKRGKRLLLSFLFPCSNSTKETGEGGKPIKM